jgi:WD40-like Beta Propeller Repeat
MRQMSDTKQLLERAWRLAPQHEDVMDSLIRRRARKERNRKIAGAVLGITIAIVILASLIQTLGKAERPAAPTPVPTPEGIFADVGGWIAFQTGGYERPYGHYSIWAVDPMRPNGPKARIQLSDRPGKPLAWSSDGSKLLIWRTRQGPVGTPGCPRCPGPDWTGLFVLNADGTETRLVVHRPGAPYIYPGGSFSPGGSKVVFATYRGGIYAVDANGGTPRLLRRSIRSLFVNPTFSPDGTKIAYFQLMASTYSLRVMNADGTGDRVLLGSQAVDCFYPSTLVRPAWSPDGTQIAFSCDDPGIRVVGADGSGLRTVIGNEDLLGALPAGVRPSVEPGFGNPYWSPDWSRIAFEVSWRRDLPAGTRTNADAPRLAIANADGTHIQVFQYSARSGPWYPLTLSAGKGSPAGSGNPTGSGLAAPSVYAIALALVVGVLIGGRRVRANHRS